jgi:hypothetical protein
MPLSAEVGINPDSLSGLYVEALSWAAEHQRSAGEIGAPRAASGGR